MTTGLIARSQRLLSSGNAPSSWRRLSVACRLSLYPAQNSPDTHFPAVPAIASVFPVSDPHIVAVTGGSSLLACAGSPSPDYTTQRSAGAPSPLADPCWLSTDRRSFCAHGPSSPPLFWPARVSYTGYPSTTRLPNHSSRYFAGCSQPRPVWLSKQTMAGPLFSPLT